MLTGTEIEFAKIHAEKEPKLLPGHPLRSRASKCWQSSRVKGGEVPGILFPLVDRGESGRLSMSWPLKRAIPKGEIREATGIQQTKGAGTGLKQEEKAQIQD